MTSDSVNDEDVSTGCEDYSIVFGPAGEILMPYPGVVPKEDSQLTGCVGRHALCGGWVDRHRASKTHDALACRRCHLRIVISVSIKTFGDLRRWAQSFVMVT